MNMPQMPSPANKDSANAESLSPSLDTPSHEGESMDQPKIIQASDSDKSQVSVTKAPSKGIEVVATDKGFYNQNRIKAGEKFKIRSEEDFGIWFKCVDPALEKSRLQFLKNKKARK